MKARTSRSVRWLRVTTVVLYLGIWGGVPLVEAALFDFARSQAQLHLHSTTDVPCPPAHDHGCCLLCRVVDGSLQTRASVDGVLAASEHAAPQPGVLTAAPAVLLSGSPGARAPPRA